MKILIALVPAIGWGIMPLITGKVGGSPVNQIFGIGAGASIIGLLAFFLTKPVVSLPAFALAFLCGALWTIGQIGQFISFKRIGVTNTVPLSTVFQLVGNSVIGILIFGEWAGLRAKLIGLSALVVVILGALATAVTDKNDQGLTTHDVLFLLCTTVGYWIYSSFPNISIIKQQSAAGIFLPEMLGILAGALIYGVITDRQAFGQRAQYLNIFAGLSWGIAAFAYILSAQANGNTAAFIWTQLNVVIATFGGILLLHEHKSPRELRYTILGILLIVAGSIATSFA